MSWIGGEGCVGEGRRGEEGHSFSVYDCFAEKMGGFFFCF